MHEKFLLQALELAKQGRGSCAPNPSVGALAVRHGDIIAQAWHQGAGSAHAEQLVLSQIPPNTQGLSLYITLEPCNHWGRTPPCVDTIINHGVEKVIFAYVDPNPLVAKNNSTTLLTAMGIEVIHAPHPSIDAFYQSYKHWTLCHKPWVTVKMAQSLDGKIAGPQGARVHLSNALCDAFTHQMRQSSDVLLTTANTIKQDNPKMSVRLNQQEYAKPIAILDSHLSLDENSSIFSSASQCLVYHLEGANPKNYPNSTFFAIPSKNGTIDLTAVLAHLGAQGFHDVWVEAGSTLFTALHLEGLVQRTYLYVTSKSLGQEGLSAWTDSSIFARKHSLSWRLMDDNVIACLDWLDT